MKEYTVSEAIDIIERYFEKRGAIKSEAKKLWCFDCSCQGCCFESPNGNCIPNFFKNECLAKIEEELSKVD